MYVHICVLGNGVFIFVYSRQILLKVYRAFTFGILKNHMAP